MFGEVAGVGVAVEVQVAFDHVEVDVGGIEGEVFGVVAIVGGV